MDKPLLWVLTREVFMNHKTSPPSGTLSRRAVIFGISVGVISTIAYSQLEATASVKMALPKALGSAVQTGRLAPNTVLHLTFAMPPTSEAAMEALANEVSDPRSPKYRQYLTPEEIGAKSGQSDQTMERMIAFLKGSGFKITLQAKNKMNLLVDCTAEQAEKAFGTKINTYRTLRSAPGTRDEFYSFSSDLKVPSALAGVVRHIDGLENSVKPIPKTTLSPTQARKLYNLDPLFNSGFTGTGRTVGISNFDGVRIADAKSFITKYNLPIPAGGAASNISFVTLSGGSAGGAAQGEGDLDLQMVLGQSPLASIMIYDGGAGFLEVITKEANDNLCDVITESYGWSGSDTLLNSAHTVHTQMTLQGITYMVATGDTGTNYAAYGDNYPVFEPDVVQIGGTEATTDSTGKRQSEVAWSLVGGGGGGGGWVAKNISYNKLPSWQKGSGVPTNINFRLSPDFSFHADSSGGAFSIFTGGSLQGISGTSASAPLCAGALAVMEQKLISTGVIIPNGAGKSRLGRIQDVIYAQNGTNSIWFDVTSGFIGLLLDGTRADAIKGWDFATGWGVPDWNALTNSFSSTVSASTVNPSTVAIYQGLGSGAVGTASSLFADDVSVYSFNSVQSSAGQTGTAEVTYKLPVVNTKLFSQNAKITIRAKASTTASVFAFNYKTSAYELITTVNIGASDTTVNVNLDPARHASGTAAKLLIRAIYPSRLGNTLYKISINKAVLGVTY